MTESAAQKRPPREYPQVLRSNADELHIPTVEERGAQRERDEAHISLVAASFIFLVIDVLWALVSAVVLDDFRLASLAVLGMSVAVVGLTRRPGQRALIAVLARGLVGVFVFGLEVAFFGASSGYILGQVLLGAAAAVLSVGRGGEGRNLLGAMLGVVGLVLAMVIGLVQEQGRIGALGDQFVEAVELAVAGRVDESRDVVNELLEDNSDDPRVYLMSVNYFASEVVQDLDTALSVAKKAAELADGDLEIQALFSAARILALQQDLVGALDYLNQVIAKDDKRPLMFMLRGQTLLELGRTQDALADFRRVEELDPDGDLGQQARLLRLSLEGPDFSTNIRVER